MKKKILSMILATSMVLSLAACGKTEPTESEASNEIVNEQTSENGTTAGADSEEVDWSTKYDTFFDDYDLDNSKIEGMISQDGFEMNVTIESCGDESVVSMTIGDYGFDMYSMNDGYTYLRGFSPEEEMWMKAVLNEQEQAENSMISSSEMGLSDSAMSAASYNREEEIDGVVYDVLSGTETTEDAVLTYEYFINRESQEITRIDITQASVDDGTVSVKLEDGTVLGIVPGVDVTSNDVVYSADEEGNVYANGELYQKAGEGETAESVTMTMLVSKIDGITLPEAASGAEESTSEDVASAMFGIIMEAIMVAAAPDMAE